MATSKRATAANAVSSLCFFAHGMLRSSCGARENNFVDAQFLAAAWPQELDNVRLLIVACDDDGRIRSHGWHLFTPIANAQQSIRSGQEWRGRDVILKLQGGHFTILRHRDSANLHPIQDLLNNMLDTEYDNDLPVERQLLHLESILGGEHDPQRMRSIAQLYEEVMPGGRGSAALGLGAVAQPPPPSSGDDLFHLHTAMGLRVHKHHQNQCSRLQQCLNSGNVSGASALSLPVSAQHLSLLSNDNYSVDIDYGNEDLPIDDGVSHDVTAKPLGNFCLLSSSCDGICPLTFM